MEKQKIITLGDVKKFIENIPSEYDDFTAKNSEYFEKYGIFEGVIKIDTFNKTIVLPTI